MKQSELLKLFGKNNIKFLQHGKLTGTEPTPPDSAPFRRFSPFFLCRASALRHQKSRKSIKNCLLTGASSFAGADFSTGKAKPAANT